MSVQWVSFAGVLGNGTFLAKVLSYVTCQTVPLIVPGSPAVHSSSAPYHAGGMLVFYSRDPNWNDNCAFTGVHSDSTMLAIGGMGCGTIGAGQWGTNYTSGLDWHANLQAASACVACDPAGCGTWHGFAAVTSKDHANDAGVHDQSTV